jgi:MFS family permease
MVPLYAVYALLFGDHGVSTGQISTLFIIWSLTSFAFEIPSGAWADTIDRRHLLVLSALIYAAGFSCWLLLPSYAGFALGFVLWGLSSAIMSGTFESLLYDELTERGLESEYTRLIGWAHSTAMLANLAATVLAAPLFALGGYALVGWISVGFAGVQAALAASLPVSKPARHPSSAHGTADVVWATERFATRYMTMLRAGIREASTSVSVRRVVLIAAGLVGLTAYDEYFPLVARDHGVATGTVPLLIGLVVAGQAVGTGLAGRTARMRPAVMASAVGFGGALISLGALVSPSVGFLTVAIGYGLLNNAMIVAEARLQTAIRGPARATVTSVYGFATEIFALAVMAPFVLAADVLSVPVLVALMGLVTVGIGGCVARWFPAASSLTPDVVEQAD